MAEQGVDIELDLIGLDSPLPMLKTKDMIDALLPGQVVLVKTSSTGSEQNIRTLLQNLPASLLDFKKENGVFYFWIQKHLA